MPYISKKMAETTLKIQITRKDFSLLLMDYVFYVFLQNANESRQSISVVNQNVEVHMFYGIAQVNVTLL